MIGMFEPEDILGLALEEGVSARLISQSDKNINQWSLKSAPLDEDDISNPKLWTILVQNLEQWSPELGELWSHFDFIPKWQQDDIMVSVAPKAVRWVHIMMNMMYFLPKVMVRVDGSWARCVLLIPFVPNQPIRLLDDMGKIIFDEVLQAGDVLYVPPRLSHHGIAMNDCLTFSFGFRRPNLVQIMDELADVATNHTNLFHVLTLPQADQPDAYELSQDSIQALKDKLITLLNSKEGDALLTDAIGELVHQRQYELLAFEDELDADTPQNSP